MKKEIKKYQIKNITFFPSTYYLCYLYVLFAFNYFADENKFLRAIRSKHSSVGIKKAMY